MRPHYCVKRALLARVVTVTDTAIVLVIADDTTGAADAGVPFAMRGMRTVVALNDDTTAASVLLIDTDSRHLPAADAAARVHDAYIRHAADRLVFKKIDSTLRGNLAAELGALRSSVVVCPASPATGRTVRDGVVHVHGIPLHQTRLWSGETKPAPHRIADALAPLPTSTVDLDTVRGPRERLRERLKVGGIVLCDASTPTDLRAIAETCLAAGINVAGAAGLADALAGCLPPAPLAAPPTIAGPTLVVIGSANPVARQQADHLTARFSHARELSATELPRTDAPDRRELANHLVELVGSGDTGDVGDTDPRLLCDVLGQVTAPAAARAGLLVLTGGETARAVLTRLGIRSLRLVTELAPGVVLADGDGRPVITKAGGFGTASTLHAAIQAVRSTPDHSTTKADQSQKDSA